MIERTEKLCKLIAWGYRKMTIDDLTIGQSGVISQVGGEGAAAPAVSGYGADSRNESYTPKNCAHGRPNPDSGAGL